MNGPVLFVSAEYPPMHGGVGDYTGRLVEALAAHEWDMRVLTSSTVHPADQRVLPRVRRWNWDVAQYRTAGAERDWRRYHPHSIPNRRI